jgi:hypothetical protein
MSLLEQARLRAQRDGPSADRSCASGACERSERSERRVQADADIASALAEAAPSRDGVLALAASTRPATWRRSDLEMLKDLAHAITRSWGFCTSRAGSPGGPGTVRWSGA